MKHSKYYLKKKKKLKSQIKNIFFNHVTSEEEKRRIHETGGFYHDPEPGDYPQINFSDPHLYNLNSFSTLCVIRKKLKKVDFFLKNIHFFTLLEFTKKVL